MYYFEDLQLDQILTNAKLVIFDMNGLIVDDEGAQFEAVNKVLFDYGITLDEDYWIHKCVGHRDKEIFDFIMHDFEIAQSLYITPKLRDLKNNFYKIYVKEKIFDIVRPGVSNFIEYIFKINKQKMAVATSASHEEVEIILGGLGIKSRFALIVCGDEVTRPKPDPEIYLNVSKKLNIPSSDCIVFEDTSVGVCAAVAAGMKCIAIPNKYTQKQDFLRANFVIDNFTSGAQILNKN